MGTSAMNVNDVAAVTKPSTTHGAHTSHHEPVAVSGRSETSSTATASVVTASPSVTAFGGSSLPVSFTNHGLLDDDDDTRASEPSAAAAKRSMSSTAGSLPPAIRAQDEATKTNAPKLKAMSASHRSDMFKTREMPSTARSTASTRSGHGWRGPMTSTSSSADRRLVDKYEEVNAEIERVIRSTQAEMDGENGELLKQVRSELRQAKRSSALMIQSQKHLLEKMERQERSGFRRMFSINREHKMDKLRNKLSEKLSQSVSVDEELERLQRQSVSLTRMSFGSVCTPLEVDELSTLEREREDIVSNLITAVGKPDAQELNSRLALFSSEKRACENVVKQVEQCETLYRKSLHLLRIALSTIVAPRYTGGLKEFVLGPYPLAVEASQLIEAACRVIQPEAKRRYQEYTPDLTNVRPPKFPIPMVDFAKRGARSNFDPSNSAAIEAIRKLRTSENVVILMQRIVIQKLEVLEKWHRQVDRDLERAETGYRKTDRKLQEHVEALARTVSV